MTDALVDFSNVASATRTVTTVPYNADVFNTSDAIARANDRFSATFPSGSRSNSNTAAAISVSDPGSGTASAQGKAGSCLILHAQKTNYPLSSATAGEVDPLQISVRNANGDAAGILVNSRGYNGSISSFESMTSTVDTSDTALKTVGVQLGIVNSRDGGECGADVIAAHGTISAGYLAESYAGAGFTYPFVYSTVEKPALWAVLADGTMQGPNGPVSLGSSDYSPTLVAEAGSLTSYTINKAWYARNGNVISGGFDIVITNKGSGSGGLGISTPVTSSLTYPAGTASGREIASTGKTFSGAVGTPYMTIYGAENESLVITGARLVGTFSYLAN